MKCPVCKTELGAGVFSCPICGFDDLHHEFISEDDAKDWVEKVVIPYRKKREQLISDNKDLSSDAISSTFQEPFQNVCHEVDSEVVEPIENLCDSFADNNKNVHLEANAKDTQSYPEDGAGPLLFGSLCLALPVYVFFLMITNPFDHDVLSLGWTLFILLFLSLGFFGINLGLDMFRINLKIGKYSIVAILYISALIVILFLFLFKVEL